MALGESTTVPPETCVRSKIISQSPEPAFGTPVGLNQQIDCVPDIVVEVALVPIVVLAARLVVQPVPVVEPLVKNHCWFPEMSRVCTPRRPADPDVTLGENPAARIATD